MAANVKIALYQTVESPDGSRTCPFTFRSFEEAQRYAPDGTTIPASYYKKVYEVTDVMADMSDGAVLNNLFTALNMDDRPGAREFRSMSMSDVTEIIRDNNTPRYYYCDTFGFKEIQFDPSKAV